MTSPRAQTLSNGQFSQLNLPALGRNDTSIVPAVNQIELQPYFQQRVLQQLHAQHGILTQAWSPIGGITAYYGGGKSAFDDPTLQDIARDHGRSPAQVMFRWHVQQDAPPFRSRQSPPASPRTSKSLISSSHSTRSRLSTRWTPPSVGARSPTTSRWRRTERRSPRRDGRGSAAVSMVTGTVSTVNGRIRR
jgi:hypothetical protein